MLSSNDHFDSLSDVRSPLNKGRIAFQVLIVVLIVVLVGFSLLRCASLGEALLEKPTVDLESVRLQDVGTTGATALFGLNVVNPNAVGIKVDALNYEVQMGGRPLTSGDITGLSEVPAKSAAVVHVPVTFKYTEVFSSMTEFFRTGESPYRIKGEARFGFIKVPFSHSGELNIKESFNKATRRSE